MRRLVLIPALAALLASGQALLLAIQATTGVPAGTANPSLIVSPQWVAGALERDSLVILHVGDRAGYDAAHIKGARHIWLDAISDKSATLRLQMPSVADLERTFEALGVSDSSHVVLYFGKDQVTPTARVFVTLDYLGFGDRVSILDGGLPAWQAAGYEVTTAVPTVVPGSLTPRPNPQALADAAWIAEHRTSPKVSVVDARLPQFYTGDDPARFPRPGRIAGARSIPFTSLVSEAGVLRPRAEIEAVFREAGVAAGDTVISYCHIGQQASLVYVAARWLGHEVRLYDGSFEEWSARPDLPVEAGPRR